VNYEDQRLWRCIQEFDCSGKEENVHDFKLRLFNDIVEKLGRCGKCTAFVPETSYCTVLKMGTGEHERCSDFEAVEEETESAFQVMSEGFQDEQKAKRIDAIILKYKINKKTARFNRPSPEES
jgi:hypothetical protein